MAAGAGVMLDAARERLRLLGLSDAQIEAAENENVIGDHVTLHTPTGGVVIAKNARQGSYVAEGDRIYTIADLSQVWVILEAYESDLPWLRYGQTVSFRTEAFGDQTFEGTIAFIDPTLDAQRRTVRVRVNVNNEAGDLRSGMFVRGRVSAAVASAGRVIAEELAGKWISPMHPEIVRDEPGDCPVCGMALVRAEELGYATATQGGGEAPLVIPDTAVLRTGQRGVVYVKVSGEADAVFEGREVQLGPRGDGFFVVTAGLDEGDLVVTRGNFQIDSALQLQGQGQASMMNPHGGPSGAVHAHHGMPQQAGPGSPQRTTTRPSTTQPSTTQPMDHGGHDEQ
jgi:Cu(I)/Ag(I) efflux system membrane fusion protein